MLQRIVSWFRRPQYVNPNTRQHPRTKSVDKVNALYRCRKCGMLLFDPLRIRRKMIYFYYPLTMLGFTIHICFPFNTVVEDKR